MSNIEDLSANQALLHELTPAVEFAFNRHLAAAPNWYPHELIEWDKGRDFKTEPWSPEQYEISEGGRSAVYVNLLTEDNLPYYTAEILSHSPQDHPLREWNMQWTSEEGAHSIVIRDWVHTSRVIDPKLLEDGRRAQQSHGVVPHPGSLSDMLAYVPMQELATKISHRNTATTLPPHDKKGKAVLGTVAGDENRHHMFYEYVAAKAFEIDPDTMMVSLARQLRGFTMPGTGIPDFKMHERRISEAGIYDVAQFTGKVVVPSLEGWNIWHIEGLSPRAEEARDRIAKNVETLGKIVARQEAGKQTVSE